MPKLYRDIIGVIVLILVLLVGAWVINTEILTRYTTKQTAAQQTRTATATTGIAKDTQVAAEETQEEEVAVEKAASTYRRRVADEERTNPVIRNWRDQPIPDSVRRLAAQREAERNRLGLGEDRRADDGTAPRTHRVD